MAESEFAKRDAWRDENVAAGYDRRRFGGALGRLKHAHDERLVCACLRNAARGVAIERLLDLPCGTGRLRRASSSVARRVVGADVSLEMLRAGGATEVVQADCLRLPFRSRAFDAVLCMRFLFHVERRETRVAMLREMARVTSGVVLVQVRFRWTAKHASRWLRSRVGVAGRYRPAHGRAGIAAEFAEAGLELVELTPVSRVFSDKALALARVR